MYQFDHDVHNGITGLLNLQIDEQASFQTSRGILKLTEAFTNHSLDWPGIIVKFVDEKGEEIWYNLELKDSDGPLQYTNSAQMPEEPVPETDEDGEGKCGECGKNMENWRNWLRVEHQTDDDAPCDAFCSTECMQNWLVTHPDYAYVDCICGAGGRDGCECED
jgi:hypothetical protein